MPAPCTRRSPAWIKAKLLDLISVWGEEALQSQLHSSRRNYDTYGQISHCMTERGHDRETLQCKVKVKELRTTYHKVLEANHCSRAAPMSCRFYKELDVILSGDPHLHCKGHGGYFCGSRASQEWTESGGGNLGWGGGPEDDSEARDECSQELFSTLEEASQAQLSDHGEAQTEEEAPEMTLGVQPPSLLSPAEWLRRIRKHKGL
ncbi:uncharacterized protein LOC128834768 [Malaclemys terrapin pileata]|uniref:uncharacterized protein LOC128834768 n=1 Tax=Malaclemys terrapin pileata TaxID=2991368 RepID=UPI0023A843D0|nr:uncharacterized protein LOC128834768 [Malaclemys terrapin pileata]